MQIDLNNFFCSSSGSGDIREKHKFQKQLDVFFCYLLYIQYSNISGIFCYFHSCSTYNCGLVSSRARGWISSTFEFSQINLAIEVFLISSSCAETLGNQNKDNLRFRYYWTSLGFACFFPVWPQYCHSGMVHFQAFWIWSKTGPLVRQFMLLHGLSHTWASLSIFRCHVNVL